MHPSNTNIRVSLFKILHKNKPLSYTLPYIDQYYCLFTDGLCNLKPTGSYEGFEGSMCIDEGDKQKRPER